MSATTRMKAGTRIQVQGWGLDFQQTWESAKIGRWLKSMGERSSLPAGYHPVRFNDGGCLMVHESRIRVTDNAA